MKNNKGFTLVELLAVIVILGVVLTIVIRSVVVSMDEAKKETEKVFISKLEDSIEQYIDSNKKKFIIYEEVGVITKIVSSDGEEKESKLYKLLIKKPTGNYNITFQDIIYTGFIASKDLVNPANENVSCGTPSEIVIDIYRDEDFVYYFQTNGLDCINLENVLDINTLPVDKNGSKNYTIYEDDIKPNSPDVSNGLVPIKYNGNNWVVTSKEDLDWYNYKEQKWANAALLKKEEDKKPGTILQVPDGDSITEENSDILAMFVWIPRFSYTIGCHETDKCYGYRMNNNSDYQLGSPSQGFPGAIDIKFISKDKSDPLDLNNKSPIYEYTVDENGIPTSDREPTNWYTHPAFNFDGKELSGIWVGKFETSVDSTSDCYSNIKAMSTDDAKENCKNTNITPRILPNVLSLVQQNVFEQYETAKKFKTNYGLTANTDTHMMKNDEWGAVAYLSHSIYGKYGNSSYSGASKEIYKNNSSIGKDWAGYTGRSEGTYPSLDGSSESGNYKYDDTPTNGGSKVTNSGTGASTTGNIYGIYDMVGGAYEYLMGCYTGASSEFGGLTDDSGNSSNNSGFTTLTRPEGKYFNEYVLPDIFVKSSTIIGHATAETSNWYSDAANNFKNDNPWIARGGKYDIGAKNGIFAARISTGKMSGYHTFRSILVTIQ